MLLIILVLKSYHN